MARPKKKPRNLQAYVSTALETMGNGEEGGEPEALSPLRIEGGTSKGRNSGMHGAFLEGWENGKVPKASRYTIEYRYQEFTTLDSSGIRSLRAMVPFIVPAPGAEIISYDLSNAISDLSLDFANDLHLPPERMEKLLKFTALYFHDDPRTFWKEGEEDFISVVLPFVEKHGFTWLKLREIAWFRWIMGGKKLVPVGRNGKEYKSIAHWLGPYERKEYKESGDKAGSIPLAWIYGESVIDIWLEAMQYSYWLRKEIAEFKKDDPTSYEFPYIEEVLVRSTPKLRWVGKDLQIHFKTDIPVDACYTWALEQLMYGKGLEICRNVFCERVFIPTTKKMIYCIPQHGYSYRAKKRRDDKPTDLRK